MIHPRRGLGTVVSNRDGAVELAEFHPGEWAGMATGLYVAVDKYTIKEIRLKEVLLDVCRLVFEPVPAVGSDIYFSPERTKPK